MIVEYPEPVAMLAVAGHFPHLPAIPRARGLGAVVPERRQADPSHPHIPPPAGVFPANRRQLAGRARHGLGPKGEP